MVAHFTYQADYGRGGTDCFQVSQLDMDDVDVTTRIDQGKHFNDERDFRDYLAEIFNLEIGEISLECVGSDDSSR